MGLTIGQPAVSLAVQTEHVQNTWLAANIFGILAFYASIVALIRIAKKHEVTRSVKVFSSLSVLFLVVAVALIGFVQLPNNTARACHVVTLSVAGISGLCVLAAP
jgi:hypothetical protein